MALNYDQGPDGWQARCDVHGVVATGRTLDSVLTSHIAHHDSCRAETSE